MTRRALVTGGFGYVGGRIAKEMVAAGWDVVLGSRAQRTNPEWLQGAGVRRTSVTELSSNAFAVTGMDAIVHLAAMDENQSVADAEGAVLVNTLGTRNMLEAAIAGGVRTFVYFSTAHVYCSPLQGHISELTLPRPVHPYAITHRGAEDFVLAARDQKRIEGIVVRLSNGIGAPAHADVDRWTLLVNDLCRQAASTRAMVLRSSGLQQRDFITLEDVGRAVLHLLGLDANQLGDGLFNLGDTSFSVLEMAQRIAGRCREVLGFEPEIRRPAPSPGEAPVPLLYDTSRLRSTGFSPLSEMDAEIDATLRLCAGRTA